MRLVEGVRLSKKGHGITQCGLEVPRLLPEEIALVEKRKRKKARLIRIQKKNSIRQRTKCMHFAYCGGCAWQHLSYPHQLEEKQRRIKALFPHDTVSAILPATKVWRYRNKMEFTFSSKGVGLIPLFDRASFDLLGCSLVDPWMVSALKACRKWWKDTGYLSYFAPKNVGSLRYLTLRLGQRTKQKMAILCISGRPEFAITRKDLNHFIDSMQKSAKEPISLFLHIWQSAKNRPTEHFFMHLRGPEVIEEELLLPSIQEKSFLCRIGPDTFFQPSVFGAEAILTKAYELLKAHKGKLLFDLYCGTAVIAMALSSLFDKTIAVEINKEAISDGQHNLKVNNIHNVELHAQDVCAFLKQNKKIPNVIVIDPPRSGLDPKIIPFLQAEILLYISCNPTTQAEDVIKLQERGYVIETIQPIDQFAQTVHCENMILLRRKESSLAL